MHRCMFLQVEMFFWSELNSTCFFSIGEHASLLWMSLFMCCTFHLLKILKDIHFVDCFVARTASAEEPGNFEQAHQGRLHLHVHDFVCYRDCDSGRSCIFVDQIPVNRTTEKRFISPGCGLYLAVVAILSFLLGVFHCLLCIYSENWSNWVKCGRGSMWGLIVNPICSVQQMSKFRVLNLFQFGWLVFWSMSNYRANYREPHFWHWNCSTLGWRIFEGRAFPCNAVFIGQWTVWISCLEDDTLVACPL